MAETALTNLSVLEVGSQGEQVKDLQNQLTAWGFDPGEHGGVVFTTKTAEAVSALQRKLGLVPNGKFDGRTADAVRQDLAAGDASVLRLIAPQQKSAVPQTEVVTPPLLGALLGHPLALLGVVGAGALLWWLTRSVPVTVEGVEDLFDGGEGGIVSEGAEPRKPKRHRRRKLVEKEAPKEKVASPPVPEKIPEQKVPESEPAAPKKPQKQKAKDAIIDVTPIDVTPIKPEGMPVEAPLK